MLAIKTCAWCGSGIPEEAQVCGVCAVSTTCTLPRDCDGGLVDLAACAAEPDPNAPLTTTGHLDNPMPGLDPFALDERWTVADAALPDVPSIIAELRLVMDDMCLIGTPDNGSRQKWLEAYGHISRAVESLERL